MLALDTRHAWPTWRCIQGSTHHDIDWSIVSFHLMHCKHCQHCRLLLPAPACPAALLSSAWRRYGSLYDVCFSACSLNQLFLHAAPKGIMTRNRVVGSALHMRSFTSRRRAPALAGDFAGPEPVHIH